MTKWLFIFRLKTKNLIKKKCVEVIRTHKPGITEYHTLLLSLETILCRKGLAGYIFNMNRNDLFWTIFFKFAVHYLRNGPEDFGSDDIYEVPRP